jgi:transcriptional regulator with XRE-family HTH domain
MSNSSNPIERAEGTAVTYPSLLGMTVRRLREHRKMSQADLARTANVEESVVSRIERGKTRALHQPNLEALAEALKVKPSYLRELAYGGPPPSSEESLTKYTLVKSTDTQLAQDELMDVLTNADDLREREQARELLARLRRSL